MNNTTQLLPGFHLSTLRRKPKTKAQKLAEGNTGQASNKGKLY